MTEWHEVHENKVVETFKWQLKKSHIIFIGPSHIRESPNWGFMVS